MNIRLCDLKGVDIKYSETARKLLKRGGIQIKQWKPIYQHSTLCTFIRYTTLGRKSAIQLNVQHAFANKYIELPVGHHPGLPFRIPRANIFRSQIESHR